MPQFAPLVLKDQAATPVSHTFVPDNITGGVATVVESSGTPIGNNRVSISLTRTKDAGRYKPVVRFTFPVVQNETLNGVTRPTVVRTAYADLTLTFDPSSTLQERKDVVAMVRSSLETTQTLTYNTLTNLEGIY